RPGVVVDTIAVRDAAARDGGVRASAARVAGVDGAWVAVVAERGGPLDAGAGLTGLQAVAGIKVATGLPVGHRGEGTSGRAVAAVGGAGVAVVTGQRIAHARVGHAAQVDGAGRGVHAVGGRVGVGVAAPGDGLHRAAGDRVAAVDRAGIPVVAGRGSAGRAGASLTRLRAVAHVAVAARDAVHDRQGAAPGDVVARVGRAGIACVAVHRIAHARAAQAALVRGTDAAVDAVRIHHAAAGRVMDRGMATATGGRARIRRAGIAVVAVRGRAVAAVPPAAGLLAVADVAVRARGAVRLVDVLAAGVGIARVLGAGVAVVAVDGVADAGAAVAALVDGAETRVGALVVAGAGLPAGREHEDEGEDER